MKKLIAFFIALGFGLSTDGAVAALKVTNSSAQSASSGGGASGGVIKTASSVKTQDKSGLESMTAGSLVPSVLNLVSSVATLTQQQKALEEDCIPNGSDIEFVSDLVKEYAKIGEKSAKTMTGGKECSGDLPYSVSVAQSKQYKQDPCFADVFGAEADGYAWKGYPRPGVAEYCADGSSSLTECASSKKKKTSNIYAIFDQISFSQEDLTQIEAEKYLAFKAKMEKCSPGRIRSDKKEAYMGLVQSAITGAGQKTNTASVWDAVGTLTQNSSGGLSSGIQSLMPAVTGFLEK